MRARAELLRPHDLARTDALGFQRRVGQLRAVVSDLSAAVVELVSIRRAVRAAVDQLEGGVRRPAADQGDAGAETAAADRVVVEAHAGVEQQVLAQRDLVLDQHAGPQRVALVGEIACVGRLVVAVLVALQVELRVDAEHQLVPGDRCGHRMRAEADPARTAAVPAQARRRRLVGERAAIVVGAQQHMGRGFRALARPPPIVRAQQGPVVALARPGIVEPLLVGGGRGALLAAGVDQRQAERAVFGLEEQPTHAFVVQTHGEAVVVFGRVELGEVKIVAVDVERAGRDQQFATGAADAIARGKPATAVAAGFRGSLRAAEVAAAPGDHVDHAEESVGSEHRRPWPGDVLDPLDQLDADREFEPRGRLLVDRFVEPVAIDQEQEAAAVVPRAQESARTQVGVAAVVAAEQTRQAGERIGQRAPAEGMDLLGRDHPHRRRRIAHALLETRCGGHAHVQQLLERQVGQLCSGRRSVGRSAGRLGPRRGAAVRRARGGQKRGGQKKHRSRNPLPAPAVPRD